jgi:phage shock protein PspC (stress-responsive transcriptional regulator)
MLTPMTTTHTPTPTDNSIGGARTWFAEEGLARSRDDRIIAGVSGAFARRFDVNPFVARVITVAAAIGFTPLIYVALWVLMPSE